MPLKFNEVICQIGNRHILYDASLIENPDLKLFLPTGIINNAKVMHAEGGRGGITYFSHSGLDLVLKHYYRGGKATKFLGDRYVRTGLNQSRAFREWHLLSRMQEMNLPAPVPVAASVKKSTIFYEADLVTKKIDNTTPLSKLLIQGHEESALWKEIGRCIRNFHDNGIYHADLNASNILVKDNAKIYLVDFDKGMYRSMRESLRTSNLVRLKRSLLKYKSTHSKFCFNSGDWDYLTQGYSTAS